MLVRLAYLTVTTTFAALRLLLVSDREKDVEILALRHQIAVLERQLVPHQATFALLITWRSCLSAVCLFRQMM